MVDKEALSAINRVRPLREGRGAKVAKCVGKALLLPEDMLYVIHIFLHVLFLFSLYKCFLFIVCNLLFLFHTKMP